MKVYTTFAILAFISTVIAENNVLLSKEVPAGVNEALEKKALLLQEKLNVEITPEFVNEFWEALISVNEDDGGVTAILNEYTDRVMKNIANLIVHHGLDPMEIPNIPINLVGGGLNLTNGFLQATSTIHRDGDVVASYTLDTKKFVISIPIGFDALDINYKYKVWVLLLAINGGLDGKLEDVKANLKLEFDFTTYHAKMTTFDITNSGRLSLHFTGNGLVDWLINLMSDATTLVLHPLIIRIIQMIITIPVNMVVDLVNNIIDSILHPTTTSTVANLLFN